MNSRDDRSASAETPSGPEDGTPERATGSERAARRLRVLEHLGWLGMALLLGAYAAVSFDLFERTSLTYVGVNVLGAALVAAICAAKRAWPAFALEIAWIVLTIPALWGGA